MADGPPEIVIFLKIKMARKIDAGADDKPGYFLHGLMSN
jgi:hypothetical protein